MSTAISSNGHAKRSTKAYRTKAYRTIVDPTPPATPKATPTTGSISVTVPQPSLLNGIGQWLGNIANKMVNAAKKVGQWFRSVAVKVAVAAKKVGQLLRSGFLMVAAAAGKVGRGLRTALKATVRVGAVVLGYQGRVRLVRGPGRHSGGVLRHGADGSDLRPALRRLADRSLISPCFSRSR